MMSGDDERDDPPFEFGDVWPDDKPFPLSDAECARLVRGHPVRWRSTLDERHRQLDDLGRGELRRRPGLGRQAIALLPVTSAQIAKACARTARYSAAGR
jgi:hypothetical protein